MNKITGGSQANKTGKALEQFVLNCLRGNDYTEITKGKKSLFDRRKEIGGKQFATQLIVGETIYGSIRSCDFFIFNSKKWIDGLIVECKWQSSPEDLSMKNIPILWRILKRLI